MDHLGELDAKVAALPHLQTGDSYLSVRSLGPGSPQPSGAWIKVVTVVITKSTAKSLWWCYSDSPPGQMTRCSRRYATLHLPTPATDAELRLVRHYEQAISLSEGVMQRLIAARAFLEQGPYAGALLRPMDPAVFALLERLNAALVEPSPPDDPTTFAA